MEEMGMKTELNYLFDFSYCVELDNNLTENELDHVFIGKTDKKPNINTDEACDYRYITTELLEKEIKTHPERYTEWFKIIFDKVNSLDIKF